MTSETTLIIGKYAKTGSRIETILKMKGYATRAVSRSTQLSFDWNKPQDWLSVMQGCSRAYVCYQPDLALPLAQQAIVEFVRIAKIAGIKHIVLLSGRGEGGAQSCEQILIDSGINWNVVRVSWFSQNFSESFLIESVNSRQFILPAVDTLEPFIDVDDIAEVAVACLTRPELRNQLFELTGPELLSFRDCAQIISKAIDSPIEVVPISVEQFLHGLRQLDMPQEMLWLMNELFSLVFDGRNSHINNGIEQVLGKPARRFQDYVANTARSGIWDLIDAQIQQPVL
ncbi:NmrA family transcriptional regulator [Alginatibacterium sediminis]|uniref:NmrA family transcriptional regulator n=1 Tax=Alginatibacterium sediminis TaxID=2164068 RepID=A0A420EDI2_9ALTE|nr:NmrA family transcriptional regulator [Alginatibacterium sediminis]RKF18735.1 NmrA family transcriptional regulator [Alginatibacterium sediminis]